MATTDFYAAMGVYLSKFWMPFAVGTLVFGLITFWFFMERLDLKRYAQDIIVRKECYRKRKTLGRIIDKAGTQVEFVCDTDDKEPGTVRNDHTLINPNLVSTKNRGRLPNGIPVLDYVLPYLFPMSHNNANALIQLIEHVRENHDEIDWIADELLIIRLLFCSDKYLYDNCVDVIETCIKMDIDIPESFYIDENDAPSELEENDFEIIDDKEVFVDEEE